MLSFVPSQGPLKNRTRITTYLPPFSRRRYYLTGFQSGSSTNLTLTIFSLVGSFLSTSMSIAMLPQDVFYK